MATAEWEKLKDGDVESIKLLKKHFNIKALGKSILDFIFAIIEGLELDENPILRDIMYAVTN